MYSCTNVPTVCMPRLRPPSLASAAKTKIGVWFLVFVPASMPRHSCKNPPIRSNDGHMKKSAYARAGVDIDLGNRVKGTLPRLLAGTHRPEVLGKVGGFGG